MKQYHSIINNKKIDNGNWLEIINPSTNQVYAQVSALTKIELDEAFKSARSAFKIWSALNVEKRKEILVNWKKLILLNKEELAQILVSEVAKSHKDALSEIIRTGEYIDLTISEFENMELLTFDNTYNGIQENIYAEYHRIPKGVGVAISPFNYPVNLSISKLAPGILTGNTFVFKPATQGSIVGIRLIELAIEAGIPAGVLNVVTGKGKDIGDDIVKNNEIDFISFTGSVGVGNRIKELASSKDLVFELGGKDAAIILDDHNLENIASDIVAGAFSYSGQRCTAIKRVITTNAIADKISPLLKLEVEKLTVGLPTENSTIVPLIDKKSADYVEELINDAIRHQAIALTSIKRKENLIWPVLLDKVALKSKVAWEEPFGPILPIIRVETIDDMIKVANESNFGLQTTIYSKDEKLAYELAFKLEVGTININRRTQRGPDVLPFLGVKDSGFGVQGIKETIMSTTRYKGIIRKK
ncbi:aldehyde dehydrogenase family protein [Mesoplasma corruscae]|uniref:Glyceraldehyde-3-phosphate dehydrogenase n=1 Tax=Mesoplasma corruscae TaxID=216874 RepID=A0A2S5RHG5_9MOLU|nr:aldehyde dehydrogenase family protein [Mesoplasma corruscae]PPE06727.1 glyceraldehyde-3-phosphate dehydrogenase [Mesoplasma corruscae]